MPKQAHPKYVSGAETDTINNGSVVSGLTEVLPGGTLTLNARSLFGQTFSLAGTLEAVGSGATVTVQGAGFTGDPVTTLDATHGSLVANGGTVALNINVHGGTLVAENGGTLTLNGHADGGSIAITNATLNFQGYNRMATGPTAALTNDTLALHGAFDVLAFGAPSLNLALDFKPTTNELLVTANIRGNPHYQIADLHLVGHYTASDFTVQGGNIDYLPHGH